MDKHSPGVLAGALAALATGSPFARMDFTKPPRKKRVRFSMAAEKIQAKRRAKRKAQRKARLITRRHR